MNLYLKNKTILISGGAPGLTEVIEEALVLEGANVIHNIAAASNSIYGVINCIGKRDGVGLELDFRFVQEALPWIKKSGGCIINVFSEGIRSGLTMDLAAALSCYQIRVNGVLIKEATKINAVKEIADTVVYLLSPNSGINGELIHVGISYAQ